MEESHGLGKCQAGEQDQDESFHKMVVQLLNLGLMSPAQAASAVEVCTDVRGVSTGENGSESANLDFLRSIAVLCVFVCHLIAWVLKTEYIGPLDVRTLGRAGVILFFVHTALVLLMSLERSTPRGRAISFYVRRIFRLYPLSIFAVLAVTVLRLPSDFGSAYRWMGWPSLANNLLLTMPPRSECAISTLWTLPYEVQMYLLIPAVYLICRRGVAATRLLWLASVMFLFLLRQGPAFDLLYLLPCFLGGALAFSGRARTIEPKLPPGIYIGVLVTGITALCTIRSDAPALLVWSWVACAVIGTALSSFAEISSKPINWLCKRLARYSYGIYLSHAPIMSACFAIGGTQPAFIKWSAFATLTVATPVLLFHYVEDPMIKIGKRFASQIVGN